MRICESIIHHINIESEIIQPCCNFSCHSIPHISIVKSGNMEKYMEVLQQCVDSYQDFCTGCQRKKTYEASGAAVADMIDLSLVLINHHRNYCNCKCIYCGFWKTPARPFPIRPLLDELLAAGIVNPHATFSWGGGESTLLAEFEDTASMLLNKGFRQELLTNALLYSPATEKMLKENMGSVMVSLDSGTAETYRAIKGIDGFHAVTDALKKYAASARRIQDITLKYIFLDKNTTREEIDSFFAFCSTLGNVTVSTSLDTFRIADNWAMSKTLKDALRYFRRQAGENGHPYFDWMDRMYPGSTDALLRHDTSVYYWGCGEYYQLHKHEFSHCDPRYILLDHNPGNLAEKDGIPIRDPSEILPHGERLPIVIFAWDPKPILRKIEALYPWYTGFSYHIALARPLEVKHDSRPVA